MHSLLKKLLLICGLTTISFNALAAVPGAYLGGQFSEAITNYSNADGNVNSASISDSGIAGRLYGGYQFTPVWAGEVGYTRYSNITYDNINGTTASGNIKQDSVEIYGKRSFLFCHGTSLYGKLGAALVTARHDNNLGRDEESVLPALSVGISFDILPYLPIDFAYTHMQNVGGSIPTIDSVGVGLAFYFGEPKKPKCRSRYDVQPFLERTKDIPVETTTDRPIEAD